MTPARRPRSLEAEGRTIQAALAKALRELGVRRAQVTVKVLAEEQKGLFGMRGAVPARVRVTLKDS